MRINAVSQEFPLSSGYANKIEKKEKNHKQGLKFFSEFKSGFNHDSPDFFRLDSMQENTQSYKNPFLDVAIEDRNLFFKNTKITRQNINIIDKLKSSREFSQNTNYLKNMSGSFDLSGENKRNRNRNKVGLEKENSNSYDKDINFYTLSKNSNSELYNQKVKQLHFEYSPRHYFNLKNSLEFKTSDSIGEFVKPLNLKIDPKKSSYLKNYNDYDIRENYEINEDKFFHFKKKVVENLNPIGGYDKKISPEEMMSPKWGSFYEKYI